MKPKNEPWRDPAAQPYVRLVNVSKGFDGFVAVNDVSLNIYDGEFFSLLGPSGCGKTTLLRLLAGFETPDAGQILLDGEDITRTPPHRRPVNMMFQSYALFPHLSVERNIAFGLRQDGLPAPEIRRRVEEMLDMVRLTPFARRRPHQLSGGQRQRVALARSLVKKPKLLLLDEPLGALDRKLREHTRFELMNIQDRTGVTFVIVTHDQEEAMSVSCRMAVMDHGHIRQVASPREIYESPNCRYVAEFVGDVTLFEGLVTEAEAGGVTVSSSEAGGVLRAQASAFLSIGAVVQVAVRPEKIALTPDAPSDPRLNRVMGAVQGIGYMGDFSLYRVRLPSGKTAMATRANQARRAAVGGLEAGDQVWLSWPPEDGVVLQE